MVAVPNKENAKVIFIGQYEKGGRDLALERFMDRTDLEVFYFFKSLNTQKAELLPISPLTS